MQFDLSRAPILRSVVFLKIISLRVLRFWRILFLTGVVLSLGVYLLNILFAYVGFPILSIPLRLLGIVLVLLPVGLSLWFFEIFCRYYLMRPVIRNPENLAERLNFEAAKVIASGFGLARLRGESELSPEVLAVSVLADTDMQEIFSRIGFSGKETASQLEGYLGTSFSLKKLPVVLGLSGVRPSEELFKLFVEADNIRQRHEEEHITNLDILAAMFGQTKVFRKLMLDLGLDQNDLEQLGNWYEHIHEFKMHRQEFWSLDNLLRKSPIGKDWIYGYSWALSHFARNLTDQFAQLRDPLKLASRKKEIDQIEEILSRAGENNVLLVGEEGVGKRHIIEEFAQQIAGGKALPGLNYKKVFELNISNIAAASSDPVQVQNILIKILDEAVRAGNIILVIEGLHNFVGGASGMGRLDITEVLLPYLRSSRFQVLATTDPINFHKNIESKQALLDVLERVTVNEPDSKQTMGILQESLPALEYRTKVFVTYGALKAVVDGAEKYIRTSPFPEKAFDLLSETISHVSSQDHDRVFASDVYAVVSRKTGIPMGPIVGEEKDKLLNLETLMRQQLVGQERAISVIAATMRRLRTGMARRGKPAGVFLFVGPTGVGKTETAKILARVYYGAENRMLRFDMSEYQELESMDRFIGSLRLNEPGQFTTIARDNPFALILLDEIEKANKNILNIFLQVFDEANLTDAFGRKVSFEQHIIIATSNAGADVIRDLVRQGVDPSLEKEKIMDVLIKGNYFRPEFLNRFDEVVIFHPLTEEQIYKVAEMAVDALAKRMLEQDYIFKPTPEIVELVAKAGFDPQFGARPIQRAVKDKLENAIAKKILDGIVRKGEEFILLPEEIQ